MKRFIKILPLVLVLLFGFTETVNMVSGNWYQQFLPNLGSQQVNNITFLDSLTGFTVTSRNVNPDTASILKTTNGGDNWQVVFTAAPKRLTKIKFINANTGFACGGSGGGTAYITKTTNAGLTWNMVNSPGGSIWLDMSVLNVDTIWVVDNDGLVGGVYRTTNGGINWTQQFSAGTQNPDKVYMFNSRLGFMGNNSGAPNMYRTTNSGISWSVVISGEYFKDINFIDSLTGWRSYGNNMYKTTNGGLNWITQPLPSGGMIISPGVYQFTNINKDTIWGAGGFINYPGGQNRGILYRTTNGGNNWLFQIPDTSIHIFQYDYIQFINKSIGWAYGLGSGVHTTNGGDTSFLTGIQKISDNIPNQFKLYQNYPNPFNPITIIKFQIKDSRFAELKVYDISGKEVITLVNGKQTAGTYEIDFSGNNLPSGVYFYKLTIEESEVYSETKKMILLK